jgi:hypothetical protein
MCESPFWIRFPVLCTISSELLHARLYWNFPLQVKSYGHLVYL